MKFHKHNLRVLGLMSLLLGTLGACAPKMNSVGIDAGSRPLFCSEASPIVYDRLKDTLETISQVKAYNAVGVRLCGWKGRGE